MKIQPNLLYNDDNGEILEFKIFVRRPYMVWKIINQMMKWGDQDFSIRFKLSKIFIEQVLDLIRNDISVQNEWWV